MEKLEKIFTLKEDYKKIISDEKPWVDKNFAHEALTDRDVAHWMRASEIFDNKQIICDSFSSDDIIQGNLGDCYLLSAISALAEFPGRVENLFVQKEINKAGCYAIRLCICGEYVDVVIDNYFPVDKENKPVFASTNSNELWVMLIEKAWAKVHGSYPMIEGGDARTTLMALTGAPVNYLRHSNIDHEELWKTLKHADEENYIMCTGASKDIKGISKNHAYTLSNLYEIEYKGENIKLVQIRNPWAYGEWIGDWSDDDKKWTPELKKKLNHVSEDDGMFFMKFEDFANVFSHSLVARVNDNYCSSSLRFKGQKASVGFRIRRPIKGYISLNQITKRLGQTVDKDYDITKLIMELHKFEDDKLVTIDKAESNSIGQANLEVNIEKGVYVIKAEFQAENKLPFIIFSTYAERKINIAGLNNLTEMTKEKVIEEIRKLKRGYTTGEERKHFRRCILGHPLEWCTDGSAENFVCESCKVSNSTKDGRWTCKKCYFDICPKCRPKRHWHRTESKSATDFVGPNCDQNHPMKFAGGINKQDIYQCDQCGKAFFGTVNRWQCELCNFNICRKCSVPPPTFKSENEELEIEFCPRNHKLEFVAFDTVNGVYECYLCGRVGPAHMGRWSCSECNINICTICKPSSKALGGLLLFKTISLACSKGHILMFGCNPPPPGKTYKCEKCKQNIAKDNWRWNCIKCNFSICTNCRSEPEGNRDILCSNYHKLIFSDKTQGKVNYGRCDKCYKSFKLIGGRYCCFGCQYNLCKKCYTKLEKETGTESKVEEKLDENSSWTSSCCLI